MHVPFLPAKRGPARRVLAAGAAGALTAGLIATALPGPAGAAARPSPASAAPMQLTLPAPTGPYRDRIGTVALHLVDHARQDPYAPGHQRELMVSLWYPARDVRGHPVVPWLSPAAAPVIAEQQGIPDGAITMPLTWGHADAPLRRGPRPLPVLLYSPGYKESRTVNTVLVENLAARGYMVVTIDHTYDAGAVEFPGGRVETTRIGPSDVPGVVSVRDADARFVLDELTAIDRGANPDAEGHPLPEGIAGGLDTRRVGMFGHSLGGATAAATMLDDRRIAAGLDLDGDLFEPVASTGLGRPFQLMGTKTHNRDTTPSWASFWAHLTGWRRDLALDDSGHMSFTDGEYLYRRIGPLMHLTPAQITQLIGTIDQKRANAIVPAYVGSFFDLHLRHRDDHLLDGPSRRYPEMRFLP